MPRSSIRPMAAVTLVAAILIYVGCSKTQPTTEPLAKANPQLPSASKPEADAKGEAKARPEATQPNDPLNLFADWVARPPAAVLLISGEQDGYLQPCGCTEGQLGGLGRRYHFLHLLRDKGWPVAAIDLGNLIHDPAGSRGGPEQTRIKFDIALQALGAMKYDSVALGPEDLKLGILDTLGVLANLKEPKFLAANIKPTDDLKDTIRPTSLIQAGKVAIGVTAVLDPADFQALFDANKVLLTVRSPDEVLPDILAQLEKSSQFQVLMVQGPVEEGKRLAEKFPGFDLVVARSTYEDPDERAQELNGGKTLLINIGKKGKYAGVVGFFPGSTPSARYRRQALDGTHFREAEPMRKLIDEDYQTILRQAGVVENIARGSNTAYLTGARYEGAESCKGCHPKTFAKWASTKHARAYDPLVNPKRNREFDAECISCHTTGFPYKTGWVSLEKTPYLKGNQCENCHGPGSMHNAEPDNMEFRSKMALTAETAEKSGFCTKCHDQDNDHNFTFASRYPQIYHKELDTYDDPKVHQPQPPKVAQENK